MPIDNLICVSVCAKDAEDLAARLAGAAALAGTVEVRFDCLWNATAAFSVIREFRRGFRGRILATFRPAEQGGRRPIDIAERQRFWAGPELPGIADLADLEADLDAGPGIQTIRSHHDFAGTPGEAELAEIFDKLRLLGGAVKIAVTASDATDGIGLWKILGNACAAGTGFIPIAMGEAGKWTRILGPAHGAMMTYAAAGSGGETAPGQITARDLEEVYRVRRIGPGTAVYGIVGGDTSASMSPYIHNAAFVHHETDAVFIPFQTADVGAVFRRMVRPETREIDLRFGGFAVTIPHKLSVMRHLDEIDPAAAAIGAVNTIDIRNGRLKGYNTDAEGFIEPLRASYGDLRGVPVAVVGAGGAARACVYALRREGANVTVIARDPERARQAVRGFGASAIGLETAEGAAAIGGSRILVNTTPVGMRGKFEGQTPVRAEEMKGLHLVYDLVYNPFETRLIAEARAADIPTIGGLAMLIAQAGEQQRIWTGNEPPLKEMSRAALERLR